MNQQALDASRQQDWLWVQQQDPELAEWLTAMTKAFGRPTELRVAYRLASVVSQATTVRSE